MILTVTLNAALDITYEVEQINATAANRVCVAMQRAGGKGLNVARVLAALGHSVTVTGFAGGRVGQQIRDDLAATTLRDEFVSIDDESRRTVAVVDRGAGDATTFLEAGPAVTPTDWERFLVRYRLQLRNSQAVVLSGSLPPGVPPDAYATLVAQAKELGIPAVLDADGPALLAGLTTGPAVIKPNQHELAEATETSDPVEGAAQLRDHGAEAVVASLGPGGLLAVTPHGAWRAYPPEQLTGNPTGAGDAVVAALVAGMVCDQPWPNRLAEAVALSAATVLASQAGVFDRAAYQQLRSRVRVDEVSAPEVGSIAAGLDT